MSVRDPQFTKAAALTQTHIGRALDMSQPAVSEAFAKPADFFDTDRLTKISIYAKREIRNFDSAAFDQARLAYLTDPNSFCELVLRQASDPSQWQFDLLWSFGDSLEERRGGDFIDRLFKGIIDNTEITLVYVTSNADSTQILFNALAHRLRERLDSVRVFIAQMPAVAYMPPMRIFDPHGDDPRAFVKFHDLTLQRLAAGSTDLLIDLFRIRNMGLSKSFVTKADSVINTPELSLIASPTHFLKGVLPHPSPNLRAI